MSNEGHARQQSQDTSAGARQETNHETERLQPLQPSEALQRLSGPGRTDPGHVLALQRTLGNQAVQRMLVQRQEPDGGGGGDSARIANLEAYSKEHESFRLTTIPWVKKATTYINDNKHKSDANTADMAKTKPWVKKATTHINSNRHRIEALESSGPADSGGDGHSYE